MLCHLYPAPQARLKRRPSGTSVEFSQVVLFVGHLLLMLSFFSATAYPADTLSEYVTDQLQQHFAAQLPEADITIAINSLHDQINLRNCTNYQLSPPDKLPHGGKLTLRTDCLAPQPWSSYVSVTVQALAPVAITARPLPRHTLLQADDMRFVVYNLANLTQGYYTTPTHLLGKKVRQNLAKSTVITPRMLLPAELIQAGEHILIEAQHGALTVKTPGIALQSGQLGQTIRVRNTRSGKELSAIIQQRGRVILPAKAKQ